VATGRRGTRGEGEFSARSRKSDVVADAVLLASAAVRIAVKNLLIVRALRERADFDEQWWRDTVARELELLAAENEADATRLGRVRAGTKKKRGRALAPDDYRARDAPVLKRRIRVLRKIAMRLREIAVDEDAVDALVGEARQAALHEITTARHDPSPRATVDPEERAAGLAQLAEDLAALTESVTPRESAEPS
jgi:nucleotidyltransferase/DNA polymerase involved in DNA repair